MKLVREHINEKFKEESDPIKDIGIGLPFSVNKFPVIFKTIKNTPTRNINPDGMGHYIFKKNVHEANGLFSKWFGILVSAQNKNNILHIRFIGFAENVSDAYTLLKDVKRGYRKNKYALLEIPYNEWNNYYEIMEDVNEKFKEESDPISDLGIGFREVLKKKLGNLSELADRGYSCSMLYDEKYKKYCSDNLNFYDEYTMEITRMIYHTLYKIVNNRDMTLQEAYEKTYKEEIDKNRIPSDVRVLIRKKVAEILEKEYDVVVDHKFNR